MIRQLITKPAVASPHHQRVRDNAVKQVNEALDVLHSEFRIDKITDEDLIKSLEKIIKSALQLKTRIKK